MLSGKAAIAGIGATDFSKNSGRSELRLAAEDRRLHLAGEAAVEVQQHVRLLAVEAAELGDRLGLERPALRGADGGAGSSGGPRAILC